VQANALLWDPLIEAVCEAALGSRGGDTASASPSFAELYCGIGFFTLPLVAAGARGVALESDRAALSHLAFNLRRAGLADRVEVLRGRAEERGDLAHRFAGVDFVLVDPPRTGLAAPVRRALIESGVERIVYLSCDPGTLARDLAELTAAGHRLVSLRLFDLFPQTSHVESLVVLEKR
jgi:23S rRNA (uracil1939-C5)-methyltransferase